MSACKILCLTYAQKFPELETVLALCKAAPFVQSLDIAEQLLKRLTPYLPESYAQLFAPSPYLRDVDQIGRAHV